MTTTRNGAPQPAHFLGAERGTHVPDTLQTTCEETCLLPPMQGGVTYNCPNFTGGNPGKVTQGNWGWTPTSNPQPGLSSSAGVLGLPSPPQV